MATLSKVANPAIRLFLTQIGKEYDRKYSPSVFDNKRDSQVILSFFNDECVYCGTTLSIAKNAPNKMVKDHLIPINMTSIGLHAWGNIVPACNNCNSVRREEDWQVFLGRKSLGCLQTYQARESKILSYIAKYNYNPNTTAILTAVQHIHSNTRSRVSNLVTTTFNSVKNTI